MNFYLMLLALCHHCRHMLCCSLPNIADFFADRYAQFPV